LQQSSCGAGGAFTIHAALPLAWVIGVENLVWITSVIVRTGQHIYEFMIFEWIEVTNDVGPEDDQTAIAPGCAL
jgi:hypothetical protein